VASLIPVVATGMWVCGLRGAAWGLALHSAVLAFPIVFSVVFRSTPIRPSDLLTAVWRPAVGVALMFGAVRVLHRFLAPTHGLRSESVALIIEVMAGAAAYATVVGSLWSASGRSDGPEASLFRRLELLRRYF
jgi:hypothetical protein